MLRHQFFKYVFVVLALALWAGTANAALTAGTVTSPSNPIDLYWVIGGGGSQTSSAMSESITSATGAPGDTVGALSYNGVLSTSSGNCGAVLTVTGLNSTIQTGTPDPINIAAIQGASLLTSATVAKDYTCKISTATTVLDIYVTLHVVVQPLITTTPTISLAYRQGAAYTTVSGGPGSIALHTLGTATTFSVDPTSVQPWLTVAPTAGTTAPLGVTQYAITASAAIPIVFGGDNTGALTSLSVGTYYSTVKFNAVNYATPVTITVTLTVSPASNGTLLLAETANTPFNLTWTAGTATPTALVTPISTGGTLVFYATCAVGSVPAAIPTDTKCSMTSNNGVAGAAVSGVTNTWGTPLWITLDGGEFNGQPFGSIVTLTVQVDTVKPLSANALTIVYQYTVQPTNPTLGAFSPTSVKQITAGAILVTLKGTNFVSRANIYNGVISPTKVFAGSDDVTANSVVLDSKTIVLTLPSTEIPDLGGGTSALLPIGVANQTGTAAPSQPAPLNATINLNVTSGPVIYGVTSTASYIIPSQAVSTPVAALVNSNVAPYELVSIFGDQFGVTNAQGIPGTLDPTYFKYGTTVNASGTGTVADPYVTLSVSFKGTGTSATAVAAPILFANNTQINILVPSGLALGIANVTVTYGKASSDQFAVNVVAADPGIFTTNSTGVGQGAVLIYTAGAPAHYDLNDSTNRIVPSTSVLAIYLTGMGNPTSTADDATGTKNACVKVSNTSGGHAGYLEVVNKANTLTGYVPPTPAWKNIDGAVIEGAMLLGGSYPPCFNVVNDTVSVDFVDTAVGPNFGAIKTAIPTYAGFAGGSVAGLYQVNVVAPALVTGDTYSIIVHIGSYSTQAGVTVISN